MPPEDDVVDTAVRVPPAARVRRWVAANRVDLLLVGLALVALGPFVQEYTAQPASRYSLSAAIWDHHTVSLDRYDDVVGIDHVEQGDGEIRSDKAPLQPILAVPFYAVHRLVGGEPATRLRFEENLGLWWVTLWSSVLPFAALLVVMRRVAASVAPSSHAVFASLAIGFSTVMLSYATQLYGHVLAALFAFAAWAIARSDRAAPGRLALAGALAGASVAIEYQMVLVAGCLLVAVTLRHRRRALWFAVGALPAALLLAGYQWIAFGDPATIPYTFKEHHRSGLVGISLPSPGNALRILAGPRGLVFTGPIALLALGGAVVQMCRAGARLTSDAAVAFAAFAALLWVQAGGSEPPYGGESAGPRYLIAALPFLAAPLAAVWRSVPRAAVAASFYGLVALSSTVLVLHLVPDGGWTPGNHLRRLVDEGPVPTVWTMALGPAGWVVHGATVAFVLQRLALTQRTARRAS
jgi:hypothetical protein